MADTSEYPPSPPNTRLPGRTSDVLSDVVLWRRKQLNCAVLLAATALWTVMDVYQYSLVTVLSWLAMAAAVSLFFWGSIHRLLKKEAPDLSELEIGEETAREQAEAFRLWAQEVVRLILHVSTEREWFVFAGVVASLYLVSLVASHFDFLTLLYLGLIGGMTVPGFYMKNEGRIAEFGDKVKTRARKVYSIVEQRFQDLKNKIGRGQKEIKEKKME
ncbi:Reticulon-like protein B13 [Striga hermonthica]|uniref:Reticulon-like protein n=1 Tax=Striga hermonthica TaxID=68872 RepID=A0A9N7NMP7_STRHE|nr:Reticulon-like protein B13 [Striga hermonthica]